MQVGGVWGAEEEEEDIQSGQDLGEGVATGDLHCLLTVLKKKGEKKGEIDHLIHWFSPWIKGAVGFCRWAAFGELLPLRRRQELGVTVMLSAYYVQSRSLALHPYCIESAPPHLGVVTTIVPFYK